MKRKTGSLLIVACLAFGFLIGAVTKGPGIALKEKKYVC